MINIDNILNTEVIKDPCEYQIIDNVFSQDTYNLIVTEFRKVIPHIKDLPRNTNGWWLYELEQLGMSKECVDLVLKMNKQVLEVAPQCIKKYSNPETSNIGYYSIPRFAYTPPNNREEMHHDAELGDKTMIMAIYLSPEENHGTALYQTEEFDSFVTELPWKANRAFMFAPVKGVTWHDSKSSDERLTMAFYYERIEMTHLINNFEDKNKMMWFYEQMAGDYIMIELDNQSN